MANLNDRLDADGRTRMQLQEAGNEVLETCLELIVQTDDTQLAIEHFLAFLGDLSGSDRVFIFEKSDSDNVLNNTCEWVRPGVASHRHLLQRIPEEDAVPWLTWLQKDRGLYIEDLEQIRQSAPRLYSYLKPMEIHSAAAASVLNGDQCVGIWGADNPSREKIPMFALLVPQLERILSTLVRRRNLYRQMADIEYRDPATGFYNLKALYEHHDMDTGAASLAVIYVRLEDSAESGILIPRLRSMRDQIYHLLDSSRIYRISPTEFVAVYARVDRERIDRRRKSLKLRSIGTQWKIRVGSSWSDQPGTELDDLIRDAVRWSCIYGSAPTPENDGEATPLVQYLQKNYFDLEFFLNGIARNNDSACFFFGDMQERLFYISDNMQRKFGFSGSMVPELPYAWADRIDGQRAKRRYWMDLNNILEKKQDCFNLYHQVSDAAGHREWTHLYGEFKWNEDRTDVLFCTGRITMQDKSLAVDGETRFGLETLLARHLARIQQDGKPCYFIGFSLNSMGKINDMEGRAFGNSLIRSISEALSEQFLDRAAFYKLSGMRYLALIRPEFESIRRDLIGDFRRVIEEKYHSFGVRVPNPCSLVLTKYPQKQMAPLDFIEAVTSCIKLTQQEGTRECMDGTAIDMEKVRANANLTMELSRDVLSRMQNFRIVVQPVVETRDSRIKGGEALLRWRNNGKDVSPGFFIPILERDNMMIQVGRWVFEESVKACRRLLSLAPDFRLSINLSLQQLDDDGLTGFIEEMMDKYQVAGSHLIVEMTESCMDTAQDKLMQFILFCSRHGITVSLDDFGTGYSSLRVLMQYPTAIIKLDRSLLLEMTKSMDKKNFISAIVFACHQFGKRVCIEGVETNEQDELVREASCDMIQGFYYYRPMELDSVYELLSRQKWDRDHAEEDPKP